MTSNANENMPWEAGEKDNAASAINAQGPRSSLSLDGRPGPIAQAPATPTADLPARDLLAEGKLRAKNMAHALGMIAVLLTRYLVMKVIWGRLQTLGLKGFIQGSRVLQALYIVAQPHIEALRAKAKETSNKAFRTVLIALITVVGPAEELLLKIFGIAKREGAKLAAKSSRSIGQVLTSLATAVGQTLKAGLTKPAVQKLAAKLIKILEEAQR